MDDSVKKAIEAIVGKINDSTKPDEALNLSQAALNLANCERCLSLVEGREPQEV